MLILFFKKKLETNEFVKRKSKKSDEEALV
jgi:hypothetical protein